MKIYSKLSLYTTALLFSSAVCTIPLSDSELDKQLSEDVQNLRRANDAASRCDLYSVIKGLEYFTRRYENEVDPQSKTSLHYLICSLYANLAFRCRNPVMQSEIRSAMQVQCNDVHEKYVDGLRARRLKK